MINITDKSRCCACGACVNICPNHCIEMAEDEQGFAYPTVRDDLCVDCHACESVCLELKIIPKRTPLAVYAALFDNDEIRMHSSSGGVFYSLATYTIRNGGVVFGAAYDEKWEVHHVYVEKEEDIHKLQTSKYIQSRIENTYQEAKRFLLDGRQVFFTGTSCQIAGLKSYLRKDYHNLLSAEVICHGVPSTKIWRECMRKQIESVRSMGKKSEPPSLISKDDGLNMVKSINFRYKKWGWKKFGFALILSEVTAEGKKNTVFASYREKNTFMRGFLHDFYMRPSCYNCPAKNGKSQSDIALGDFWEIWKMHPEMDDDKGTSLVLIYTEKGHRVLESLSLKIVESNYEEALIANPSIEKSKVKTKYEKLFWDLYPKEGLKAIDILYKDFEPSIFERAFYKLKNIFCK